MKPGSLTLGLSAIIIDNDKDYRKSLSSIIRKHLMIKDIYTCGTGREALGISRQVKKIDLIVCDSDISDQPCLKLVQELRENKSTSESPVVLLSTNSKRDFLLEAAACGVTSFILKPFSPKTVTEKLSQLLGGGKSKRKTKRIKLFNSVECTIVFKSGKYKGTVDDISKGGCMINMPPLENGGTIFDQSLIRIGCDDKNVDIPSELIRLERDNSSDAKRINAAFIFMKMNAETQAKFEKVWKQLDKSAENSEISESTPKNDAA